MQNSDALVKSIKKLYKHNSSFISGCSLLLVDCLAIMLTLGISFFIVNFFDPPAINFRSFGYYWIYLPLFFVVFYVEKLYPGIMLSPADEVRRCAISVSFCFGGVALSIVVISFNLNVPIEDDERIGIGLAFLLSIPIAIILLPVFREIARKLFSRFLWWGVSTVIYCDNKEAELITDRLIRHPEYGYRPVLILNPYAESEKSYHGVAIRKPDDEIHSLIQALRIKSAIIIETSDDAIHNQPLGDEIISMYRYTVLIPDTRNILSVSLAVRDFGGILGFASVNNLTKTGNLFCKRLLDLFLVIIASPLFLLLTAIIAFLIRLSSPGPVFYGHTRIGKNGKEFKVWKFRTMVVDAEKKLQELLANDPLLRAEWELEYKLKNDPRITPLGKTLREMSLDELPQFWNIFLGQLSFVGPRPVTKDELMHYGSKTKYILSVTPGLSGMWQISGRSNTSYAERIMLDSYYIQNWSVWLDIWIILQTFWAVLRKKGAY